MFCNQPCRIAFILLSVASSVIGAELREWRTTEEFAAPEAKQAAAADERFVYVVTNDRVAKYDRITKKLLVRSTGEAKHLNSAFIADGRIYLAHSNFPTKPERSEIFSLDVESMKLETFHDFANFGGSLTWCVRRGDEWWCNFALYGSDNRRTFLVRFDHTWKETGRWTYPAQVLDRIGGASISGGIWHEDSLLVSDHDHKRLYRVRLPTASEVLEFVAEEPAPLTGQGFAADLKTGGLVGIDRARKHVVLMQRAPSP
ncbi:MAG: endonuclease [Pirellula sp.]|nr:endonuclease [Pirellula sp.]